MNAGLHHMPEQLYALGPGGFASPAPAAHALGGGGGGGGWATPMVVTAMAMAASAGHGGKLGVIVSSRWAGAIS